METSPRASGRAKLALSVREALMEVLMTCLTTRPATVALVLTLVLHAMGCGNGTTDPAGSPECPGTGDCEDSAGDGDGDAPGFDAGGDGDGQDTDGDPTVDATGMPCDVSGILAQHCTHCHSSPPRYGAPMSLTS